MIPRDPISGDEITIGRDGPFITIVAAGVPVIYLNPSAALLLARQLIESVTAADAINTIGGTK